MPQKKETKQSSITSMGFLFFGSPQRCVWADRSRFLDPTGQGACQMKKRIHCTRPVLNLIIKPGFDEIIRDSLNGVKSIIYLRDGITLQLMQIRIYETSSRAVQ
jgi:hypothetical protein